MEIDEASIGKTDHQTPAATIPDLHQKSSSSDRKRKKSASSSSSSAMKTSSALKSILRQRTDLVSGCYKARRKRSVKFMMEDKPVESHKWSDKRLRCLALDLDRWDNLPYSTLRSINKQKTRHTKRLKCCRSNEDQQHGHAKTSRTEMDDWGTVKVVDSDMRDSDDRSSLAPENLSEMESIEKSFFITRWLQQNARTVHRDQSHVIHNFGRASDPETMRPTFSFSLHPPLTTSTFTFGVSGLPGTSVVTSRESPAALGPTGPTGSLQNLAVNFHGLSLKPSSCRHERKESVR